jgi:hypothetical protein
MGLVTMIFPKYYFDLPCVLLANHYPSSIGNIVSHGVPIQAALGLQPAIVFCSPDCRDNKSEVLFSSHYDIY